MSDPAPIAINHTRQVAEAYSSSAEAYSRLWSPVIRPMAQPLLAALPLRGAERILDLGTGSGGLIPDIRSSAPQASITAVDLAEGMLRIAMAAATASRASLALMDAQHLAISPAAIDVAVMAFVLFHVPDPHQALGEVLRVLRTGGTIGIATWGADEWLPASAVWDEELQAQGAGPDPVSLGRQDKVMDTPERLRSTLEQAGFNVVISWARGFEHQWDATTFFALRSSHGVCRRRLDTLEAGQRSACLSRVRERLALLPPADFIFRPEAIFAIARKPENQLSLSLARSMLEAHGTT
jgi:ubiquinone/menaquinone biosynthesis C-methylase UbiE